MQRFSIFAAKMQRGEKRRKIRYPKRNSRDRRNGVMENIVKAMQILNGISVVGAQNATLLAAAYEVLSNELKKLQEAEKGEKDDGN